MSPVGKWAGKGMWAVRVRLPAERSTGQIAAVEALLEPMGAALTSFEIEGGKGWSVESLCERRPAAKPVQAALQAIDAPPATIDYIAPRNWVAETQRLLAPIRAGRFFVHGAHFSGRPPRGTVPLQIEASIAFGTGRHETTRGCLLALDRILNRRRPRRILDVGTGTGVLAIAAARATRRPVLAGDIDAVSVRVARDNARLNHVGALVEIIQANGLSDRRMRARAPFDLVFANILLDPLELLAKPIRRLAAPGARIVVSGLLPGHANAVLAAYRALGLVLERRILLDGWATLILLRPAARVGNLRRGRQSPRVRPEPVIGTG